MIFHEGRSCPMFLAMMEPEKMPIRLPILGLILLCLVACGGSGSPQPESSKALDALAGAPDGELAVSVNGEVVSVPLLEAFAKSRGLDPAIPEQRERAREALVELVVLAQSALRSEAGRSPEQQAEMVLARVAQLSSQYVASLRTSIQITDEQLREYYAQEAARAGATEYHIAHILFADAATAQEAARRAAEPGVSFEAMMEEYAAAGALQARDLGWGNLAQMPEAFPEMLATLADGQVAQVPVQTTYGWHVLHRIASRPFNPPSFDDVREGARTLLIERAVGERVRALRSEAKVQQAADPA